ncbi:MAG: hypothetical protein IIB40_03500 [Candidatus Marinimicrobia bacterium]|nr:hypothetical protein [Candidatus Neomarinimicrobiota bacterium]
MQKTVYMPPEAKIITLHDFSLEKIDEYFQFAVFERKVSTKKSHSIAHAMIENRFTDNVLRGVPGSGSAKYDVIDGQDLSRIIVSYRQYFN